MTAVRSLLGKVADKLDPPPDPYVTDPAGWVRRKLRESTWSKQKEIMESVRDNRRTAVHSCHGAGKSHIASRVAGWWIDCHPPGEAFVVTTAPSWAQVKVILWRYIGQMFRKAKKDDRFPGRVNQTEWLIGDEPIGYGRKPADEDEEGFQGVHAKYVLVIVDEAAGIPSQLWTAILALLTTSDCRVLAIGNPDYEGSPFSRICAPGSAWNVIHIDGLATPNFTDEQTVPGLLDQTWIDDLVSDYGIDSPQYVAKVRGLFPTDNSTGIIPWSWVHQCRGIDALERVGPLRVPIMLGVDVGGGGDLTVIRERCGPVAGRRWAENTDDSEIIVDAICKAIRETGATEVKIDFGGIGFGVVGSARRRVPAEVEWPVTIRAVNFGAKAKDPDKYLNVRAELWWEGRLRSKPGTVEPWDLSDVDDRTMADLTEPQWFETKEGRVQVEAKAEVQKRLGRSPDDGDALLLAFYDPPAEDEEVTVGSYRTGALRGSR